MGCHTHAANDERYEVPGSFSGQLKYMKNRRNAEQSDEDDGGDLARIVVVENILRSWNEPRDQGHHFEIG
jgi:hypothetical protein